MRGKFSSLKKCSGAGQLPPMTIPQDYFALFDLLPDYDLDLSLLRERYRRLRSELHPDRYAAATAGERARAAQYSTHIQHAFQVLDCPLRRAAYLLGRAGRVVDPETEIVSDKEFLLRQMEWRERLEELAHNGANPEAAASFAEELTAALGEHDVRLRSQLQGQEWEEAADTLARLRFLHKLEEQRKETLPRR